MRYLTNIIFVFLFSMPVFAADIVVNVDPNPVVDNNFVRVSVVSELPITEAVLLVGNDVFPLERVSDQLFKLKFRSFLALSSQETFINVVFSSSQTHVLPVAIKVLESNEASGQYLDVKNAQAIKIDNTKLEIERLEDKLDLLDQKNQILNKEIAELNENLENQKKLALSQAEIEAQKAKLKELLALLKQEELAKQASIMELKRKMEVFNTKQKMFDKKEKELNNLELELSQQSQMLLNQGLQFEKDKDVLKQQEKAVDKQQKFVRKAQKTVAKDEKMVERMKADIDRQKKELSKQNKRITKKEKVLDSKMATIAMNQSTLVNKEKTLKKLSEKITGERHTLVSISAKLDMKKKALKDEKNKFYAEQSEKESVIKKTQQNINSLEKKMLHTITTLSRLEQDHLDKSVYIEKERSYLRTQRVQYEKDREAFDKDYKNLKLLETEISVRVEIMNDLGSHIDGQLDQMHKQMIDSQHSQLTYESEMNDKVTYLNNLTKLIEKRAKKMEYKNNKLKVKNKKLYNELVDLKAPHYRYAFSPYMSFRLSDSLKSDYDEFGFVFSAYFRKSLSLSAGVGSVNYMNQLDSDYNQLINSRVANVSISYLLNPKEKLGFYVRTVARRLLTPEIVPVYVGLGIDLKYNHNNRFSSFFSAQIADGSYLSIGIEKYIIPTFFQTANTEVDEYHVVESNIDKNEDSYISLSNVDPYFCFFPKVKMFRDVSKSWYQESVEKTASYGLFDLHTADKFNPKGYLTYKDASYALVWTRYIDQVLRPDPIRVNFSLISDFNPSLLVSFYIVDEQGNRLVVLKDKQEYFVGEHVLEFDPIALSLKEGRYRLLCELYSQEVVKGLDTYEVKYVAISKSEQVFDVNSLESLVDFPVFKSEFRSDESYPFLKKAVEFEWFRFNKRELALFSNVAVTRLEFIEIVGRFLLQSGARDRDIDIDLTYYNDLHLIPKSKQPYLKEYIIELGYGGDHNQNLNPNQYLTRAEFAVIMNRLLRWKQKTLKDKNIILDFDQLVVN